MLLLLWRGGTKRMSLTLSCIALASLALAHWGAFAFPTATFYLLPTRAWELLMGALAAIYLRGGPKPARAGAWLGAAGLGMIALAVFVFDHDTPFPSLYALLPTLGTVLVILYAAAGSPVHYILASRPAVGIGLISYSVYLWHQPLLAFYRHWSMGEVELPMKIALSGATLVFGYLT